MKSISVSLFVICIAANSFAMKSHQVTFNQPCDVVWKAAIAIAKTNQYRIISVAKDEQIISLAAGGAWWGERVISLNLGPGTSDQTCIATVQSRYSGLQHSDGPDLLVRIRIQLVGDELGRDSKDFQKYKDCVETPKNSVVTGNEPKCAAKLRRRLEAENVSTNIDATLKGR